MMFFFPMQKRERDGSTFDFINLILASSASLTNIVFIKKSLTNIVRCLPISMVWLFCIYLELILAMLVKHLSYMQLYIMHVVPPSPSLCLVFPT